MKKYLISGMAALMFCGVFTSCTRDTDLGGGQGQQQKVMETYEQAFLTRFGQPAANQDWGFGSPRSNTRAEGYEVGARPEANMWTSWGFLAPDPLTPSQKLRAQYYFQMVNITDPYRPDYGTKDFFMQQVYDGGTNPMPGKSPEVYDAADGNTKINSGEHMDHLTCGPDHTHTYNFNNGTCSTNDNVANRDQTDVNNTDGKQQHSDEIQLMLNTKTSCFGYANSDASYVRDDRWTLVSAKTIDDFCDGDANFKTWLKAELAKLPADANKDDVKCVDDFNRSYIGFDFDMIPDESVYSLTPCDANGNIVHDTYNNPIDHYENNYLTIQIYNNDKIWNGTALVDLTDVGEWGTDRYNNRVFYPYMPGTTEKVRLLSENKNQYCGTSETWSDDDWKYTANGTTYTSIANMISALNNFKLPSNDKTWVTIGNCADGYYSDWIVTFMPATPGNTVTKKLRVIAEDLSVDEYSDFDFNDVVFDVIWTKTFSDETKTNLTSQKVEIELLAAGGTLPLYVDGREVHEQFNTKDPEHSITVTTMVNTRASDRGLKGKDGIASVIWETTKDPNANTIGAIANSIEVKVEKNGEKLPIEAIRGKVTSKIAVGIDYDWCKERQDIEDKYSLIDGTSPFQEWVQGIYPYDDWYTYAHDEIMKYRNKRDGAQGN